MQSTCSAPCVGKEDPRRELLLDQESRCHLQLEQGIPVHLFSPSRLRLGHSCSTIPKGAVVPMMHGATSKSIAIVVGATTGGG